MTRLRLPVLALALCLPAAGAFATEAALEKLLPTPPAIRKILDRSCVMCHGEVIDGQQEIRDDLDLSTDDAIRQTMPEVGRLKQYILEDTMPRKPKLGRRLRNDPKLQERLTALKADFEKSGDKAVLLEWLKDIKATTGEKKKDH